MAYHGCLVKWYVRTDVVTAMLQVIAYDNRGSPLEQGSTELSSFLYDIKSSTFQEYAKTDGMMFAAVLFLTSDIIGIIVSLSYHIGTEMCQRTSLQYELSISTKSYNLFSISPENVIQTRFVFRGQGNTKGLIL